MKYTKILRVITFINFILLSITSSFAESEGSEYQKFNVTEDLIKKALSGLNIDDYVVQPIEPIKDDGLSRNTSYEVEYPEVDQKTPIKEIPLEGNPITTKLLLEYFDGDSDLKDAYKRLNISRMKAEIRELQEVDSDLKKIKNELAIKQVQNQLDIIKRNSEVINNVNYIGYFIFIIAHLFLSLGAYTAFTEFKNSNVQRKKARTEGTHGDGKSPEEQHEFSIGLEGIALKTSLHGTLIFVITMGFYYLYLVHVYKVDVL